ncbi:serine protease inhibitor 42Dd [Drosophila madeirensis]|uniref:Serine protease inhibitor 42Dd n=1 Tax=Drosophila madeirensis TaxID=30013 RepID=A0AAU9GE30_DROMD
MHKQTELNACSLLSLLFLTLSLVPCIVPVQATSDVTMTQPTEAEFSRRLAIFSLNVYQKLSLLKPGQNVVFSPFSIQTCAAMARMGADGETAAELDRGLGLVSSDAAKIAQSFHQVLAAYENSPILHIANKVFVMEGYPLREEFNQLLTKDFLSAAQSINFAQSAEAAGTINAWVEQRTNNLIKDLVPASALDANSRLVLVNAIHFKGTWEHKFPQHATQQELFHSSEGQSTKVPMMNLKKKFRYAALPELDAAALELPYADSDLSMLIVLPNSRSGLTALEEKLRGTPLSVITQSLQTTEVVVKLPKFKAEFQVELSEVFQQLGMSKLFGNSAEFNKMLQSPEQLKVSAIIHKAFIDVNEEGTEAAAATGAVVRMKRCIVSLVEPIEFHADHPFIYALLHRADLPLFWGSVVQLEGKANAAHNEL